MNTVYINRFCEEKNQSLVSDIEIQTIEYSPLVIAKKKILVPEILTSCKINSRFKRMAYLCGLFKICS